MKITIDNYQDYFGKDYFAYSFKVFHDLMAKKIREILLVSSPYDAFILEEDGRLAERIVNEYRGLNLSHPPKFTWASSTQEALDILSGKKFDLVITMPRFDDINPYYLGEQIKERFPDLPVLLLAHDSNMPVIKNEIEDNKAIDNVFLWNGDSDLLLAIIKSVEDKMNVAFDTERAKVRVVILVEDSPRFLSSLLPVLYREIVSQTQEVIEESLNEEDRILRMRARPKILLAQNYEQAKALYEKYKPYLLCIISDIRFKHNGKVSSSAGFALHRLVTRETPGLPYLLMSSEESNRQKAEGSSILFLNKNHPSLHTDIRNFFIHYLGFGDFIFRYPDGREVARVSNLREMEKILPFIPNESIKYHRSRNDFSTWLMARSAISLASVLRSITLNDFSNQDDAKTILVFCIHERRKGHQLGVIADFALNNFDPDNDFTKIGKGSLGGKARGLAFIATLLEKNSALSGKFPGINIRIPKTLVISTEYFDKFVAKNSLREIPNSEIPDSEIVDKFLSVDLPADLRNALEIFLKEVDYPLAIRSSSILEDAQYQPYAGIYNTYIIPNDGLDFSARLENLIKAVKMVYASTYLEKPRAFARSTLQRTEEEKMAVIIQEAIGRQYGNYFYPAISGVAQSYNFYAQSYMKPEEGIAHIALGLGKTVVEGGKALRFSPKYPQFLPHFSTVDNILQNSQKTFFALTHSKNANKNTEATANNIVHDKTLKKLNINDCINEIAKHSAIRSLFSSYSIDDHKIVDYFQPKNHIVLTFANILKYNTFPLPEILTEILKIGRKGMGSPVEIEFAVNYPPETDSQYDKNSQRPEFVLLQIRPMSIQRDNANVKITQEEIKDAFCFSTTTMGNGTISDLTDIVYVKSKSFDPAQTIKIANEISKINKKLHKDNRKYLLIGPGRWGSADRWLGIPVNWNDISGIKAIIETTVDCLKAEPSQGTHFFHNISSLGIGYITVTKNSNDFIDEKWLDELPAKTETEFLRYIQLTKPLIIKMDGRKNSAVILK